MPKIIGGSLHEHREQTRQRLFTALATLMEERGFDAISFAEIANAAGVGRTAVYNHFADKEALLLGYIQHETTSYVDNLQRSIRDIRNPVDRLRAYIQAQARLNRVFHVTPGVELRSVLSEVQLNGFANTSSSSKTHCATSSTQASSSVNSLSKTSTRP